MDHRSDMNFNFWGHLCSCTVCLSAVCLYTHFDKTEQTFLILSTTYRILPITGASMHWLLMYHQMSQTLTLFHSLYVNWCQSVVSTDKMLVLYPRHDARRARIALLPFWALFWVKTPFCNRDFLKVPFLSQKIHICALFWAIIALLFNKISIPFTFTMIFSWKSLSIRDNINISRKFPIYYEFQASAYNSWG